MDNRQELTDFFLNISTNIFMELDSHGQILYASDKARYVFCQDKLIGASLPDFWEPDRRRKIQDALQNVSYQHYPETLSLEFQERYYNLFLYPRDKTIAACFEDVTERRHLSHHLHQSRQRLDFAERTAHLGYWELDLLSRKFYWSAEMFRIFGQKAARISSKRNLIREGILPEDMPIYKQQLKKLVRTSLPVEGRLRLRRPNGEIVYCLFRAGIIFSGRHERIAGTFQDITSVVHAQKALIEARRQAEEANKAKTYFLAQASHDLRQPMQALQLFIQTLSEEKLKPAQLQLVNKISASADGLKSLLDNLLDITTLDSGGVRLECETFDIGTVFCPLCMEYHQTSAAKNIEVICRVRHFDISSDPLLIERVVRNLFSNALKYAKNKIFLSCRPENGHAKIRIIDNGVGINPEEISLIFDEFYQSGNIENNRDNGVGLGLSIVKRITRLLNASIRVRSKPGAYTAFELSLPLNTCK